MSRRAGTVAARPHPTQGDEDSTDIAAGQFHKGAYLLGADVSLDKSDAAFLARPRIGAYAVKGKIH